MALSDFNFYSQTYGGKSVSETEFPALVNRAYYIIIYLTFNRVKSDLDETQQEAVKMAECSLVDEIYREDQNGGRVIASESIGDRSTSYADTEKRNSPYQHYAEIVWAYLIPTGLMYRGLDHEDSNDL